MPRRTATPRRTGTPREPPAAPDRLPAHRTGDGAAIDPLAEPLHRGALRLLRLLKREDAATGVSAARLSALSVLVFGGPCSLGALAAAEQVSAPTMTRLVQQLETEGLVRRQADLTDARSVRLVATQAAVRLMHRGRDQRLAALTRGLSALTPSEKHALEAATAPLLRLVDALGSPPGSEAAGPRPARSGRRRLD
jgi:DNA-binding MarR family transcriptional regulator